MELKPQERKGFVIDSELAETLELLEEYMNWEDSGDYEHFCSAFEEKYGIYPDKIESFQFERNAELHSMNGFEWDKTYVLFEDYQENTPDWEKMIDVLEEEDINIDCGSWAVEA